MATIVYLEVEDEITTAAARVRNADAARVGIVVPFGSRVATSRINFRLLAREALEAGRRLDVVAPDASARALAASAGLPVFASVAEYEAALEAGEAAAAAAVPEHRDPRLGAKAIAGGAAAAGAASNAAHGPEVDGAAGDPGETGAPGPETPTMAATSRSAAAAASSPVVRDAPVARPARRGRRGLVAVAALVLLALVVGFGGAAAAQLLPSAEVTLTPVMQPVTPVSLTVRADTTATSVDPTAAVIPATSVPIPLTAQGDFAATGVNVVQTSASGQVTFDSTNTVSAVPIAAGTRVSTLDGIVFQTAATVTVPQATVVGSTITHGFVSVGVQAATPGPRGNVPAKAIDQVPSALTALQISVSNGAATAGGARTQLAKVTAGDVTAATQKLGKDLQDSLATALADPSLAPAGTTLYPETAKLGTPTFTPEAASLPGKVLKSGQTTFSLQAQATATVTAVDESPLEAMGDAAIRGAVTPGYQIVEDSINVTTSEGTVGEDGTVSYTVTATALQTHPIDAGALKAAILGKTPDEAKAVLANEGTAAVTLWPFWVSAVPTNADRVTLTIGSAVRPAASPTPSPTPRPTATPHATPKSSKPAASGKAASPGASEVAPSASPVPSG
jgi:hypothetical protein